MSPKYNQLLEQRYIRALHRILGMAEQPGADTLSPELIGSFAIQIDRPDWSFLESERLCAGQVTVAAAALNRSWASIVNPTDSGILVTVHSALVCNLSAASAVDIGAGSQQSPGAGVSGPTDSRWPRFLTTAGTKASIVANNNNPAGGLVLLHERSSLAIAPDRYQFEHVYPIPLAILSPGNTFVAQIDTVNVGASFSFRWRERPARPDELAT